MKLEFKWSRLEFFAALELYQIIMARESVFVVERFQVSYADAIIEKNIYLYAHIETAVAFLVVRLSSLSVITS